MLIATARKQSTNKKMPKAFGHLPGIILVICLLQTFNLTTLGGSLTIKSCKCQPSSKYLQNFTVAVVGNGIDVDLFTKCIIGDGMKAYVDIQIRLKNSQRYQTIFVHEFDVCEMFVSLNNSIYKKWLRSVLDYGNFMASCPVSVGHYFLHGWQLGEQHIPKFLGAGDYRLLASAYFGEYKSKNKDRVISCVFDLSLCAAR